MNAHEYAYICSRDDVWGTLARMDNEPPDIDAPGPWQCHYCPRSFHTSHGLAAHCISEGEGHYDEMTPEEREAWK